MDLEDMPEELQNMIRKMISGKINLPVDPSIEIAPLPTRVTHPLWTRVTLTPESRKNIQFPREPEYGVVTYNAPCLQWVTDGGDPSKPLDAWDCVVALRRKGDICLYTYRGDQLRAPVLENIDADAELDRYRLPPPRTVMVGDEVCLDEELAQGYTRPIYPCKGLVVDVFPEVIYMQSSEGAQALPVDCVIRCVDPLGKTVNHVIYSGRLMSYVEARLREEGK